MTLLCSPLVTQHAVQLIPVVTTAGDTRRELIVLLKISTKKGFSLFPPASMRAWYVNANIFTRSLNCFRRHYTLYFKKDIKLRYIYSKDDSEGEGESTQEVGNKQTRTWQRPPASNLKMVPLLGVGADNKRERDPERQYLKVTSQDERA